jgi:hypothetical protein
MILSPTIQRQMSSQNSITMGCKSGYPAVIARAIVLIAFWAGSIQQKNLGIAIADRQM